MSPVLLDTHALIWLLLAPERLPAQAANLVRGVENLLVSPVSIFEIDNKRRSRKADITDPLWRMPRDMHEALPEFGFTFLDVTAEAASLAANLDLPHRDPWDRLLLAQASLAGAVLVTGDTALHHHAAGVPIVW